MTEEAFQPISVKPPSANPLVFAIRCLVDLQLKTIVEPLRPAMAALPPGDMIDIGAGLSPWREWLPAGAVYYGLDIDTAGDFGMAANAQNVHFYDGGVMPFPDARFDGAICIEVLEHAADPVALIAETARVLKPGAPLLLTVPWSARRHFIPHDFHRFTRERLRVMLETGGFVDVRIEERGDEAAVIANKLIMLTIASVREAKGLMALVRLPLALVFGVISAVMLAYAHLSMAFGLGADEDPLGYFCVAVRAGAKPRG